MRCNVCAGFDAQEQKFVIGHEVGHCVARFNGGPWSGSSMGDQGIFRARDVG